MPKLTNDASDDAQRKKGIADEELAKKEAERARKRELEERDEELIRQTQAKRRRSKSVDSVSTISTNRSASPPPRKRSPLPASARRRQRSPDERKASGRRSFSPESEDGRSVSRRSVQSRQAQSPSRRHKRSLSRNSHSPPGANDRKYRERDEHRLRQAARPTLDRQQARYSSDSRDSSVSRGGDAAADHRYLPRSPDRRGFRPVGHASRADTRQRGYRREAETRFDRDGGNERQEGRRDQRQPERERSLSPFSKRLAMTQAMNMTR